MGDVAQILGAAAAGGGTAPPPLPGRSSLSAATGPNKALKMAGISKEVMDLLVGQKVDPASADLPPMVPTFLQATGTTTVKVGDKTADTQDAATGEVKIKVGTKWISSSKRARPWTWAPFASSSRTDGATFNHWVRANVEYTDYPYAKFDIHLDPVVYSVEEYQDHLQSTTWTKAETDKLMELARTFELRWPVIYDRWFDHYQTTTAGNEEKHDTQKPTRKIEDLQARYYGVAAKLSQIRIAQEAAQEVQSLSAEAAAAAQAAAQASIPGAQVANNDPSRTPAALQEKIEAILMEAAAARQLATSAPQNQPLINHLGTGSSNKMFDLAHERERRQHLDRLWHRSKEEEAEEMELRKELRVVEAQLRKLKKSGGHLLAAGASGAGGANASAISSAASSRNPSRSVSPVNIAENSQVLDQSFASTAPVPMPQTPYLQSGRLVPPATGPNGINKSLLAKMDHVLDELHVPPRPMPTKRVCDLYDAVRKDILTLVTLQKLAMQREGILQSKRVKLAKLGGTSLPPEDRALDEEKLLGILPPPKPSPSAGVARSKVTKKKVAPGGVRKVIKKAPGAGEPDSKPAASPKEGVVPTSGKKKIVKRKRKVDPSKPGAVRAPASTPKSAASTPTGSATASAKKRPRKS